MSLGEKIMKLRKKQGLSQEELGEKIKVTRQTISNWELGETNPNPEQLKKLSQELNISIDELLDNNINNILVEKVSNTEKNSITALGLLKAIAIVIIIAVILFIVLVITKIIVKSSKERGRELEESIHCKLYGEEHSYGVSYYELTGELIAAGGDSYFYDILDLGKYDDAHQIINIINDYVKKNGGTCIKTNNYELNDIVNMSIKDGTLTKTSATVVITENEDYDISYGEPFWIEKYDYQTNNWNKVKSICDNCGFNLPAYTVTPDHPLELNTDWKQLYGELDKGLYRIVKNAFFDSDTPVNENDEFYIWVEFLID